MNDDTNKNTEPAGIGLGADTHRSLCGCHMDLAGRETLLHLSCSPRHCRCADLARTHEAEGWAALVDEVEVEDFALDVRP